MNDKQLADQVHMLIHSLRLLSVYKPSEAEKKLSRMVIERFKEECEECKTQGEAIKSMPEKKGLFAKIGEAIKE